MYIRFNEHCEFGNCFAQDLIAEFSVSISVFRLSLISSMFIQVYHSALRLVRSMVSILLLVLLPFNFQS